MRVLTIIEWTGIQATSMSLEQRDSQPTGVMHVKNHIYIILIFDSTTPLHQYGWAALCCSVTSTSVYDFG